MCVCVGGGVEGSDGLRPKKEGKWKKGTKTEEMAEQKGAGETSDGWTK